MFAGQMSERYIGASCRRKGLPISPPGRGQGVAFPLTFGGREMGSTQHLDGDGSPLPAVLGVCIVGFNWDEKKEKLIKVWMKTDIVSILLESGSTQTRKGLTCVRGQA